MIVVDTNLLAYLLLPTAHTVQADAVLLKDPDWVAPALIHSEFRNVLLGAVRRKEIEANDARVLLDRATEVITVPDGGVDGQAILSLALESGCSAYDCEFAWLARALRVPFVTADRQVLGAFPNTAVPGDAFLAGENEVR
ncbi:MAG: type II toxin-antitoxin system VapC family toxin [Gammaproteobacteria bacterium]